LRLEILSQRRLGGVKEFVEMLGWTLFTMAMPIEPLPSSDPRRSVVVTPLTPLIPNAEAVLHEFPCGNVSVPVIVPELKMRVAPRERCWLTCLESTLLGFLMDEWQASKRPGRILLGLAKSAYWLLSRGPWRRAVQAGSLPFSTTLRTPEEEQALWRLLPELRKRFPDRPLAVRHVFLDRLPEDLPEGAVLLPVRPIYLLDLRQPDAPRSENFRRDRNLFKRSGLRVMADEEFDAARVLEALELYQEVYREKHSPRAAIYTPDFIALARARGWLKLCGLADADSGRLLAFSGLHEIEGVTSSPMLGYVTSMDRKSMLYRHLFSMLAEHAQAEGLWDNASSGAGEYKRRRGYVPQLEHLLVCPALCGSRRWSDRLILALVERCTRTVTLEMMIESGA
jgi:hypothetical protein